MSKTLWNQVLDHPKFVGLWTYRPYKKKKQYCASIMVDGVTCETRMHSTWLEALDEAWEILSAQD